MDNGIVADSDGRNVVPCLYFCPEDGETVEEPNCIFVRRHKPGGALILADVKQQFPLKGEFVFRVGLYDQKSGCWLWLDREDDFDLIEFNPGDEMFKRIILKVSRKSWSIQTNQKPQPSHTQNKPATSTTKQEKQPSLLF